MISFDKKFIFVHINKTAGTSIEKALSNYGVRKLEENSDLELELTYKQSQHFNTEEYKKHLGDGYDDYYKFTIIRNPFDRVVSYYYGGAIKNNLGFKDWVVDRYQNENYKDYIRMYSDFTHWFEEKDIDSVLRFEKLAEDFKNLKTTLNLDCDLGWKNVNKSRSHYKDYYDEESRGIIENHFDEELKTFDYKY